MALPRPIASRPGTRAWGAFAPFASLILISTFAQAEILFWPARLEIVPGADPSAVSAVDFNGDRNSDLAIALHVSGDVQISLGRGDGTFDPGLTYPTGLKRPSALAASDVNGDAAPDLVVADQVSGDVAVLIGLGNGSFASPVLSPGVPGTTALAVGDVDGDQVPDLAVAGSGIAILRGLGDGTFATPDLISTVWPRAILLADVNGDRRLDLLTGANGLEVRLGNGDATFAPPVTYLAGALVSGIGAGQLLGDNSLDVAVAASEWDSGSGFVQVLEGLGNGALLPRDRWPVHPPPAALAIGDLDRDRWPDAAVVGHVEYGTGRGELGGDPPDAEAQITQGALVVLLNHGDGTFADAVEYEAGPAPQAVAITNLDHDGAADVLVANRSGAVAVLLGTGDGRLAATPAFELTWSESPSAIAVADLDQDGAADLVLGSDRSIGLHVRPGNGDGTFGQPVAYPVYAPTSVAVADLNGDGRLDVATRHGYGEAAVLLGQADGSLGGLGIYPLVANVNAIAVGDLTGDRVPDIAGVAWAELFESGRFAVAPGRGDGSFDPPVVYQYGDRWGRAAAIGELTGDDLPDLALLYNGSQGPGLLQLWRNRGDGSLASLGAYTTGSWPRALALGDLDGDRATDVAVANTESGDVWVYRNRGDGGFDILDPIPAGDGPTAVAIADLSGDQVADLAVANVGGANLAVLVGRGDGTFAPPATYYGVLNWPIALAIGPLDDQPGLDVVVSGLYTSLLSLLLSREREPVAVALTAFTVAASADGVTVQWEASEESSVLGYHVYRGEHGATGGRVRITPDLVLAGSGRYTITDAEVPPGRHDYWLEELGRAGGTSWYGPRWVDVHPIGMARLRVTAEPEPFAVETVIAIALGGDDAVRLRIYDLQGRLVRTLLDREPMTQGMRRIPWAGTDEGGRRLPSGTYVYLAEAIGEAVAGKLTIVR